MRISEVSSEYPLRLYTWAGTVDLALEPISDPIVMDNNAPILVGNGEMQGYSYPHVVAKGNFIHDDEPQEVSGWAWMNHFWGKPESSAMDHYEIITLKLDNGGALFIAAFHDEESLVDSNVAYMHPDGNTDFMWKIELEPTETFSGPISKRIYNIGWKLSGDVQGRIEPLARESEMMIDQGVGAFWLGPCAIEAVFEELDGAKVGGKGFCRVAGSEIEPGQAVSKSQ